VRGDGEEELSEGGLAELRVGGEVDRGVSADSARVKRSWWEVVRLSA